MTLAALDAEPHERTSAPVPATPRAGWLVGPGFDALVIANVGWPLVLLAQFSDSFAGPTGVEFWQLYWITTPHRWITLLLVFLDADRLRTRRSLFLLLTISAVVLCATVQTTTGALTCLMAIDYVWNAWHFASQHHGIYRIYDRLGQEPARSWVGLHKGVMRGFLLYVIFRVASFSWSEGSWHSWLPFADGIMLIAPVYLILHERVRWRGAWGRGLYLVSMLGLYLSLLAAVHFRQPGLVLALATASALFHAIEYLALVSWSMQRRHAAFGERMGLLAFLAPRWGLALAVFLLVLGAGAWLMDQRYKDAWLFLNVVAAFLHYAFDGLIWRRA